MLANEACIARGTFLIAQGTEVRVGVHTSSFFDLHALEPSAHYTWESLNMEGYFAL